MIRFLPVVDVWLGTEGHRRAEGGCRQQSEGKLELNLYVSHIASSLSADIHKNRRSFETAAKARGLID